MRAKSVVKWGLVAIVVGSALTALMVYQSEKISKHEYNWQRTEENSRFQQNVPYKLSEGGRAILVPQAQVHDVRLKLASAGLPKGGMVGFEIMENQKLGISHYKGLVMLNGFRTMIPYEGAEVWNCEAYDTSQRETRVVYVGKVGGDFIVHTNASYCTTTLQKRAAKAALAAMKASMVR